MTPRIIIATSVRAGEHLTASVTMGYAESSAALREQLGSEVIGPKLGYGIDNVRARNRIAGQILRERPDATHVLWWDDDQWPEDTRIVQDMLEMGVDIIGGVYPRKKYPISFTHQPLEGKTQDARGLLEVRWVGMGFTLMSRRCLEKMAGACRIYSDLPHPHRIADMFGMLFFQPPGTSEPEDHALLSEDQSFCERWRAMGEKVYVYTRGLIYHAGPHAFSAAGQNQ